MGRFHGGMEFPMGHPVRLSPPPEQLPAEPIRLTCRQRPEVVLGQVVEAGQLLSMPVDPALPCHLCPITGTVRSITPWQGSSTSTARRVVSSASRNGKWYDVAITPASASTKTALELKSPGERDLESWYPTLRRLGPWAQPGLRVALSSQLEAATRQKPDMVICVGLDAFPPYPDRSSLLVSFPDDVALGTRVLAEIVGARTAKLAASNHKQVVSRCRKACRNFRVKFAAAENIYPAADPTMVLYAHARGRTMPIEGNPMQHGVMLITPWTAIRIARWLTQGKLDLIRPVMLAGFGTATLKERWVFAGQPLATVDPALWGSSDALAETVLVGNPMTGRPIWAPSAGNGQLPPVVPEDEHLITLLGDRPTLQPEPCISCGWCSEVCPTQLRPIHLMQLSMTHSNDNHLADRLPWCIDCGLCSHVCPTQLPLAQAIGLARGRLNGTLTDSTQAAE